MSDNFEKVIAGFTRHIEVERTLSAHTVDTYCGDLESLLAHLESLGIENISSLELVHQTSQFQQVPLV